MIERYSLPEISQIWTDEERFRIWLDIEILFVPVDVVILDQTGHDIDRPLQGLRFAEI